MIKKFLIVLLVIFGCSMVHDVPQKQPEIVNVPAPSAQIEDSYNSLNSVLDAVGVEINWENTDVDFISKSINENKWSILYFYADGCKHCEQMDQITLHDVIVVSLVNKHFIPVKFNIEQHPEKYYYYAMRAFEDEMSITPATVFISPDGQAVVVRGIITPDKMIKVLNTILENYYELRQSADKRQGVYTL